MNALRVQVPRQEEGRADDGTLIWTRANRSARFFDYVVDRLSEGNQPDITTMGDAAYILRSTAFYSNGKFGLADFDRLDADHPLCLPYRAHMLTAWLLRELSYDLVEHCARARNPLSVRLSGDWRRYLGLGNATGLGMVPYVINHPHVLDAWCATRELPLAHALAQATTPADRRIHTAADLLERATHYFRERADLATAPSYRAANSPPDSNRSGPCWPSTSTAGRSAGRPRPMRGGRSTSTRRQSVPRSAPSWTA